MGVEVEWSIEPDRAPIPDGQTVPHRAEVAETAIAWDDGRRRAHLRLRFAQALWWLCVGATAVIILTGSAR